MQTQLAPSIKNTSAGRTADTILRSCVHCGFCTATCPTYRLLGDELDGPRGRIYLIKGMLEGRTAGSKTRLHLDRCLTCRSCETTCPSGVEYGRLLEIGRNYLEERGQRPIAQTLIRKALRFFIPYPGRLRVLLGLANLCKPMLPRQLRNHIKPRRGIKQWPAPHHGRRMLILEGCVQSLVTPGTNIAAARLLDRIGISLIRTPAAGCCGGISQHLAAREEALGFMRRNIDAWWPHIEGGTEAIVATASGCGAVIKEYGFLLKDDPAYAEKARRVSALARDIAEVMNKEDLDDIKQNGSGKIAFHSPCTLQHGLKLDGMVESLLRGSGFTLVKVRDSHLCCGSAGTYSLLQPKLSRRLLDAKLQSLQEGNPDIIATANIGCQLHLAGGAKVPVVHWVELLDSQGNF